MRANAAGFAGEALAALGRLPGRAWAVLVLMTVAAVLVGLLPAGGRDANVTAALVSIALWLVTLWVSAVLIRFMTGVHEGTRVWAVDGAFLRFLGSQFAVTIGTAILLVLAQRLLRGAAPQTVFAANFAAQVLVSLVVLPFAAWFAALAVDDRTLPLGTAVNRMHGAVLPLAGATLLLVLPVQLLHALLAGSAAKAVHGVLAAVLGIGDGVVMALSIALPCALFVAAWRFVRGDAVHRDPADLD